MQRLVKSVTTRSLLLHRDKCRYCSISILDGATNGSCILKLFCHNTVKITRAVNQQIWRVRQFGEERKLLSI